MGYVVVYDADLVGRVFYGVLLRKEEQMKSGATANSPASSITHRTLPALERTQYDMYRILIYHEDEVVEELSKTNAVEEAEEKADKRIAELGQYAQGYWYKIKAD